jgi:cytochrome c-type biogenesis protein CcmE
MKSNGNTYKIAIAIFVILGSIAYLSISAEQSNKSYYVTIKELQTMGNKAYTRHLRVAGQVVPGSIVRQGPNADFTLYEKTDKLRVEYVGQEPPPDTFKSNSPTMAVGTYGRDGVFHATELQSKCASHYAPAQPGAKPGAQPAMQPTAKNTQAPAPTTAMADAQTSLRK